MSRVTFEGHQLEELTPPWLLVAADRIIDLWQRAVNHDPTIVLAELGENLTYEDVAGKHMLSVNEVVGELRRRKLVQ
jgi:hypothetical protein